ncbi:MAG: hypothetical protein AAF346_17440 [Pseudomonadota bacterium]
MKIVLALVLLVALTTGVFADETCPVGEVYNEEQEVCVSKRQS